MGPSVPLNELNSYYIAMTELNKISTSQKIIIVFLEQVSTPKLKKKTSSNYYYIHIYRRHYITILTWGHNGQHSVSRSANKVVNGKYAVWWSTMTLVCCCDLHGRKTREISSSLIPRPYHHLQYGKLGRSPVREQAKNCLTKGKCILSNRTVNCSHITGYVVT